MNQTVDPKQEEAGTQLPAPEAQSAPEASSSVSEHMIPKSRLDEVISQRNDLTKRLEALEKQQKEAQQAALAEQGKWKEIADTRAAELEKYQGVQDKVKQYEETLHSTLEAQLKDLTDEARKLVPEELSVAQQLQWIARNKSILMKQKAPDIGSGKRGGSSSNGAVDLSPEEVQVARSFGMTPEEYAKFKDGSASAWDNKKKQGE